MRRRTVTGLIVSVALTRAALGEAAVPPDPLDPKALDVVLGNTAPLCAKDVARVREEASRIWAALGILLEWPEAPRPPRPHVVARLDWTALPESTGVVATDSGALGWITFVDGRAAHQTIVVSAARAARLARGARFDGRAATDLPATLRDLLLTRIVARSLAHEIGHYLLGPDHTRSGLMQAHFSIARLIDPSTAGFTLSRTQTARLQGIGAIPAQFVASTTR